MRRLIVGVLIIFILTSTSSSSASLVTDQKIAVVDHFKQFFKECTPKFQDEINSIIQSTIKSNEYTLSDYILVTQGIYMLETDELKGVLVFMNDKNKEVYLSEVYFNNKYEIIAINTEWIGVKLK